MTVAEAHVALAQALGDPIDVSGSPSVISDGVRYSKALRDNYLYRAMTWFVSNIIKQSVALPPQQQSEMIQKIFPTWSRSASVAMPSATWGTVLVGEVVAYIYAVRIWEAASPTRRPYLCTQKPWHELLGTISQKHILNPDPAYSFRLDSTRTDTEVTVVWSPPEQNALNITGDYPEVLVDYLPMPVNPSTYANGDVVMDFEPSLMDGIISKSVLYGRIDSQDLVDLNQLAQVLTS